MNRLKIENGKLYYSTELEIQGFANDCFYVDDLKRYCVLFESLNEKEKLTLAEYLKKVEEE